MIVSLVGGGEWLLIQAAHADTVLVRQVGEHARWFESLASILSALMSLAMLALTVAIIPAARNFRKTYAKVDALLGKVSDDVAPVLRQAGTLIANVEHITTTVRNDIEKVQASIKLAHEKLELAVAQTEKRMNDFNALLEVVQDEAESVFVATASTVRGVRTGAASLHNEDEEEAEAPHHSTSEELDDGHDDSDHTEAGTPRPRLRKQRRGWA